MSDVYEKGLADIKKYDSNPDEALVQALAKNYALVMNNKDASSVACSDSAEKETVRKNFLKKKLGLTLSDSELDAAVDEVCKTMSGDRMKSRLTMYYLLTKKFGKESVFV